MTQDATAFARHLRAHLPPNVSLGQADPSRLYPLVPGETLPPSVPKRLAEFSAGRHAARSALSLPDLPLPIGSDRAPIWPPGRLGSITHCAGLCLAIVGQTQAYQGIGLDAEPEVPMRKDLWDQILRPEELAADGLDALVHFVAKEAVYKAQYNVSKQAFGFQTLRLSFTGDRFVSMFMEEVPPYAQGAVLNGVVLRAGGFCGALVTIRQAAPDV